MVKVMVDLFGSRQVYRFDQYFKKFAFKIIKPNKEISKPVFISGLGRSGSYLLYDILSVSPDFVCLRRWKRINRGIYGYENYGKQALPEFIRNPFPPIEGNKRFILKDFPQLKHGTPKYDAVQLQLIKNNFCAFLNGEGVFKSQCRLLDKAPQYTFLFPILEHLFPDAMHIFFLRNPVHVIDSTIRRNSSDLRNTQNGFWGWKPEGWENHINENEVDKVTWATLETLKTMRSNLKNIGDRVRVVKFEDLVKEPWLTVTQLTDFLEVKLNINERQINELIISDLKCNSPAKIRNGKYFTPLSDECKHWGYDL